MLLVGERADQVEPLARGRTTYQLSSQHSFIGPYLYLRWPSLKPRDVRYPVGYPDNPLPPVTPPRSRTSTPHQTMASTQTRPTPHDAPRKSWGDTVAKPRHHR